MRQLVNMFLFDAAHSNMPDFELQVLQQSLEEPSTAPILIICDNVLSIIDIDMVEVIIFYSFF